VEKRLLGRSGLRVSRMALGTMTWGGDTDAEEAASQLVAFVDAGGTLVDTADIYGEGESERVLGSLLGDLVPRDDVVLATKAVARRTDGPFGGGASRGALLTALDGSLKRLGTDHIDLWQLHAWDTCVPIAETLAALEYAVTSGKARYVGVSNFAGWQTARSAAWQAAYPGRAPIVAAQMEYSLLERGIERELLPASAALGLGVLAWSPLGRGVLTGKYRNGRPLDSRAATEHLAPFVQTYLEPRSSSIVQAVVTAAAGLGVSPLEVAIAWVRDRPGVAAPILGARTAGQLQGALQSEDLTLPSEIANALDDVSAIDVGYPEREGVGYPDGEG